MFDSEQLSKLLQHDLKSPISGILTLSQLILLEASSHPEVREYAQAIYDRGQKMMALLDNIVDLEKIEKQEFTAVRIPIVINTIAEQILKDYERPLKFKSLNTKVLIQDLPLGAAPIITFEGKENLIWGIIDNTFRNAFEAAPTGSLILLKFTMQNHKLHYEIENEGEIPFEIREKFFDPFTTTKPQALGLGNYAVKLFSQASGGSVSFITGEGKTTVEVQLQE